jgi:hypothetical protein
MLNFQISHGEYTLFSANIFVGFRACSHTSNGRMNYDEFLLATYNFCIL